MLSEKLVKLGGGGKMHLSIPSLTSPLSTAPVQDNTAWWEADDDNKVGSLSLTLWGRIEAGRRGGARRQMQSQRGYF